MPYETDVLTSMLPDTPPGRRAYPEPRSLRPRDLREQTPPSTIPSAVYQRLVGELKGARQHISQLTQEKQALETANQQLRQEVENLTDQLQSSMSQTLDRLRRLSQATSVSKNSSAAVRVSPPPSVPETASQDQTYSFLEKLKQRQSNGLGRQGDPLVETNPTSIASSAETAVISAGRSPRPSLTRDSYPPETEDFALEKPDPGQRSRPSGSGSPPRGRRQWSQSHPDQRSSYPSAAAAWMDSGYPPTADDESADLLEELGIDPQDMGYVNSLYQQRSRERQASSRPMVFWIFVVLLLAGGSFLTGFLAVQRWGIPQDPPPPPPTTQE